MDTATNYDLKLRIAIRLASNMSEHVKREMHLSGEAANLVFDILANGLSELPEDVLLDVVGGQY